MLRVPPDRHPDAIAVPRPFRGAYENDPLFKMLFLPLFDPEQVTRLYTFPLTEGMYFITGSSEATIHFPKGHRYEARPMYDWFAVAPSDVAPMTMPRPVPDMYAEPKSVKFGWLSDAAQAVPVGPSDLAAHFEAEYAGKWAKARNQLGRLGDLIAKGDARTDDESRELSALEAAIR